MAKYINPDKIIDLINKAKIQFYNESYEHLLNDEYGLDQRSSQINDYIRILIKCLEYEFGLDEESDITYDLYIKLSKFINIYNIENQAIDNSLQISTIYYIFIGNGSIISWGNIIGNIENQEDLILYIQSQISNMSGIELYDPTRTYNENDLVLFFNDLDKPLIYVALEDGIQGITPGTDNSKWEISNEGAFVTTTGDQQIAGFKTFNNGVVLMPTAYLQHDVGASRQLIWYTKQGDADHLLRLNKWLSNTVPSDSDDVIRINPLTGEVEFPLSDFGAGDFASLTGDPYDNTSLANALDNKQDLLTFDNTPTDGSTNPVTSDGIKEYVDDAVAGISFNIASDESLETQITPVEDGELVSKHGLIYWWNWLKGQPITFSNTITAFKGVFGLTTPANAHATFAPSTNITASLNLRPSSQDYTGSEEGASWNLEGELKFLESGLINRLLKIYNNELLKSDGNYSVSVNQYGDISAVNKEIEAFIYNEDAVLEIINPTGWIDATKTITEGLVFQGQFYHSATTKYFYFCPYDDVIIRMPIRNNRCCTKTVTITENSPTYQDNDLIAANVIHFVIQSGSVMQGPFPFDPTTGTITLEVFTDDILTINYT